MRSFYISVSMPEIICSQIWSNLLFLKPFDLHHIIPLLQKSLRDFQGRYDFPSPDRRKLRFPEVMRLVQGHMIYSKTRPCASSCPSALTLVGIENEQTQCIRSPGRKQGGLLPYTLSLPAQEHAWNMLSWTRPWSRCESSAACRVKR